MQVTVSPATLEDRQQWQTLYYGYAEFYEMPMNQEILDNVWSWIFDAEMPFYCLLAKDNEGKALGLMHYRAMPSPLRGRMVGFLDDLFVSPDSRGQGTVDALFEALTEAGKANGWPNIKWITADNNYRARSVYDKLASKTHWVTYQMDTQDTA
ncbi:GNAT family N-acetyltransferase [Aestuariirhabdus sp. Z084]|uniref:GNAT family N-acetyltransferase n=1 Tax=Aestuariirhabdus haliotis TaxID=2918751 RepID=UPI00201B3712|nr:GNAT family N-acetyltransferase [Aestuariirhabdus haliotis]MCL6417824.1 GNAT family N-acetyltransferase [Aestuariirhabdus haliotis]MCL6421740.1 GNAT family N-acetyltransferase [Aestuariirhabdus haliotis]